jgi:hypothetical protein
VNQHQQDALTCLRNYPPHCNGRGYMEQHDCLGARRFLTAGKMQVMYSVSTERDGQPWIHCSVSFSDRCPIWDEMIQIKRDFIGPDRFAFQVAPPDSEHVNLHPYCLHWWAPCHASPLPDFRKHGMI